MCGIPAENAQVTRIGAAQSIRRVGLYPSRKLRRFESFICHILGTRPLTSANAGTGPFLVVGPLAQRGEVMIAGTFGLAPEQPERLLAT